jgi:hypothetical protein
MAKEMARDGSGRPDLVEMSERRGMYLARRDDGGVGGGVEGGKLVTKRLDRTGSRKGNADRGTFRLKSALNIMVYDGESAHYAMR